VSSRLATIVIACLTLSCSEPPELETSNAGFCEVVGATAFDASTTCHTAGAWWFQVPAAGEYQLNAQLDTWREGVFFNIETAAASDSQVTGGGGSIFALGTYQFVPGTLYMVTEANGATGALVVTPFSTTCTGAGCTGGASPPQSGGCQTISSSSLIEENDTCVVKSGSWTPRPGHGGSSLEAYPTGEGKTVRYPLNFASGGVYRVEVHIPNLAGLSVRAPYDIRFAGGRQARINYSQVTSKGRWSLLGRFFFDAGGDQWLQVAESDEPGAYVVAADAIRITKETPSWCPCPITGDYCHGLDRGKEGCFMTARGGYCDPNGDGNFSDRDPTQGSCY
jgi:hypothetical protein